MNTDTFTITAATLAELASLKGGNRLDRWLAAHYSEHSRSTIQRWIKEGQVIVNGSATRANHRLVLGDTIQIQRPDEPRASALFAEDIPLSILYEDDDVVVVDKPPGMVVHPAPGHQVGTLVNALLHHVPDLKGIGGEARPGIAHRLDKDTSGAIVVAKHEVALRHLQAQFKARSVVKHYLALLEGNLGEERGQIDGPIGRDLRDRKRMAVYRDDASARTQSIHTRSATTEFEVIARYSVPLQNDLGRGNFTLVQAHPITGRTHQIRVHFADRGHPIVGDPIYGLKRQRLHIPRLFLHASRLAFMLPGNGQSIEVTSPLPPDLQSVLDRLNATADL